MDNKVFEEIKTIKQGDILVCRPIIPINGPRLANLATKLNIAARRAGVKIVLLPPEVEVVEEKEEDKSEYPKFLSPGRWELSNGEIFQGKKAAAIEAENALKG
jgi:hypothetical protein